MLLLIPMVFSVYTSEMKTNGRSLSILEYLQRYLYYVQVKIGIYIKELNMYKEICMYIKRIRTYTVREAHDRLRNSRKTRVRFHLQIGSIMEKRVKVC